MSKRPNRGKTPKAATPAALACTASLQPFLPLSVEPPVVDTAEPALSELLEAVRTVASGFEALGRALSTLRLSAADPSGSRLLTVAQVARRLGVSSRTVARMAADGRLAAHRLPGVRGVRFRVDDVLGCLTPVVGGSTTGAPSASGSVPAVAVPRRGARLGSVGAATSLERKLQEALRGRR
jgi:excisionase family DNA binding protein